MIPLTACILLASSLVTRAEDKKADPTGTWKWSFTGQNGQSRETTLTLKLEGDKLTGKISGRGSDIDISDAKVSGDDISFNVTRERNGNSSTQKYSGKLSGDTITGKIEFERNGESQSRDWEAKRETEKPKEGEAK
jgi:hypothetical protein